jgi:hypothetical protein
MKRSHFKTADDVIVPNGEAGMRRLAEATKHILSVPKSAAIRPSHRKRRGRKK